MLRGTIERDDTFLYTELIHDLLSRCGKSFCCLSKYLALENVRVCIGDWRSSGTATSIARVSSLAQLCLPDRLTCSQCPEWLVYNIVLLAPPSDLDIIARVGIETILSTGTNEEYRKELASYRIKALTLTLCSRAYMNEMCRSYSCRASSICANLS